MPNGKLGFKGIVGMLSSVELLATVVSTRVGLRRVDIENVDMIADAPIGLWLVESQKMSAM
jgi:hypothetical protein